MSRRKKLRILLPVVILLFLGAYAKHHFIDSKFLPESHLQDKELDETSGIAASAINPDIYYVHNDSGDTSRFFAITPDGKLHSTIYYKGIAGMPLGVRDCEDIAVGPGPTTGKSYVYIGDIGDNASNRGYITVYRAEEKKAWAGTGNLFTETVPVSFTYPDGPKDAETLMVDPIDKLFYIVTKRADSVSVYTAPLSYKPDETITLTFRCKLFFKGLKPLKWITAGDISKDGKQVLLKSYEKVYYWRRKLNQPVWKAMQGTPQELAYKAEKQGEAIGFTSDGKGYLTTSEGIYAPVYYYESPAD